MHDLPENRPDDQIINESYLHIVFSTRKQEPVLDSYSMREGLYDSIGHTCDVLDCPALMVGGHNDHIHILCKVSVEISVDVLVTSIMDDSQRWIRRQGDNYTLFSWQESFCVVSVGGAEVSTLTAYIANQDTYHCHTSFEDEYRAHLEANGIEYDEKEVWE